MQKHNCQYTVGPSQRCEVCGIRKELTDPQTILTRETRKNCLALAEKYGLTEIPENVEMRLKVAQAEKDLARSTQLARKAINSMEIACLAAWARGEVDGPDSPRALEAKARSADGLVRMLEKKGEHEAAEKQRNRAKELRERALAMAEEIVMNKQSQVQE